MSVEVQPPVPNPVESSLHEVTDAQRAEIEAKIAENWGIAGKTLTDYFKYANTTLSTSDQGILASWSRRGIDRRILTTPSAEGILVRGSAEKRETKKYKSGDEVEIVRRSVVIAGQVRREDYTPVEYNSRSRDQLLGIISRLHPNIDQFREEDLHVSGTNVVLDFPDTLRLDRVVVKKPAGTTIKIDEGEEVEIALDMTMEPKPQENNGRKHWRPSYR